MALNHNISISGQYFHIQTEQIKRNDRLFSCSQIFIDGRVIWSQKLLLREENQPEQLKNNHRTAFNFLKSIYHNNQLLNPVKLQIPFDQLKQEAGINLLSGDLFHKTHMLSLAGYNRNRYASRLFKQIFHQSRKESSSESLDFDIEYIFLKLAKDRAIVIGELDQSELIYALLFNMKNLPFGLLIKVLLPQFIDQLITNMREVL